MHRLIFMILACLALSLPPAWATLVITGKVVGVHDGDSITVLAPTNQQIKVRLNGIDAPELSQAFGKRAKQALSGKVFGQIVTLKVKNTDRYGRTVADVWLGERWINLEMVAEGWAWHSRKYSKSKELATAEQGARRSKAGLWVDKDPVPPWEYRRPTQVRQDEPGMDHPLPLFKVEW
jgi:endonuclease YncB( thermonuclease family)